MDGKEFYKSGNLESQKDRVDTLFLQDKNGEHIVLDIPYCEYYNKNSHSDYNLGLLLETGGLVSKYDLTIRIDAILLIPVEETEE